VNALAILFACHLVGDFLLQNDWMQRKSKSSFVCTVHVAFYAVPFALFWWFNDGYGTNWYRWARLPELVVLLILCEHWLQDRFALHLRWMKIFGQTTPDKWPVGPLCIDQALHKKSFNGLSHVCTIRQAPVGVLCDTPSGKAELR